MLRSEEYHNWAEFYAGRTWHLADPQRRVFDHSVENYLTMRIIERNQGSLMRGNRRFESSHPALEVQMK